MTALLASDSSRATGDAGGYVFISYARKDSVYVTGLVAYLEANGVRAWCDREIPNGVRWRQTLRSRVEQAATLLLVESPYAQESEWVEREIIHAEWRRRPMLVLLLDGELRYGIAELQAETVTGGVMPSQMFLARARDLVARANEYVAPARTFKGGAVIPPEAWQYRRPEGMIDRPAQVEEIAQALRSGAGTIALTGIYGGGGLGKTVVAQMVVARKDLRARFPGGLLWVDLGQEVRDATLADLIGNLCVRLGGRHPELFDPVEAGKQFAALLANRPATLVVLDDVWFPEQLEPFDVDAGSARFLVTTRVTSVLPPAALAVSVDQLDNAQSRTVLLAGLPTLPDAVTARLVDATGGWALVVNSANAILRRAIRDGNDPANYAVWLADTLTAEGVGALDLGNQHARDRTFAATMHPSLALLSKDERRRACELSIFTEDTDIDVGLVGLLWNATGNLAPAQTRALAAELRDLNLLTDFRPEVGTLRIHDLVRAHLAGELGTDETRATHRTLLDTTAAHFAIDIGQDGPQAWWDLPASTDYIWRHLGEHLIAAGQSSELDSLLTDLRWTQAKLLGVGAASLDADFARSANPAVVALRQALLREAHLLGDVSPRHSHADILAARLSTIATLTDAVDRFRQAVPTGVVRVRPGWALPDAPDTSVRRVLTGHTDTVTAVAIAPDGTWLATASADQTVRLWDAATGRERATLAGHTGWIDDLAVAPDGTWLVSVSGDRTARLWDAATGHERAVFDGMPLGMTGVAIAPDGTWIAISGRWGTILVDATTGVERAFLSHPYSAGGSDITDVAVAPDGSWLATASWDRTVRLWDTPPPPARRRRRWPFGRRLVAQPAVVRCTERATLTGHTGYVYGVAISPDGTWLATASGSPDSTVRLWDAATGDERAILAGHDGKVTGVAIAPDGTWLATTGSWDQTVRIWDSATGAVRAILAGHTSGVEAVAIAPDGSWLATAGSDGTVRLWDMPKEPDRPTQARHTGDFNQIAVAPDGTWLATSSGDNTVRYWDATTGSLRATLTGHTSDVTGVAIAPDGDWAVSIGKDKNILLWDGATRHWREDADYSRGEIGGRRYKFMDLSAVAISPDGTWIATRNDNGSVFLWDRLTHSERALFDPTGERSPDPTRIGSLAIAPDGTWLATCGNEPTVQLWDTATGLERGMLNGHGDIVNSVAIAPDGSWLATASQDHTVRLWDATSAVELAMFTGLTGWMSKVAISPSGMQLATASADGTVRLWDAATGVNLATMRVAGWLTTICWAPDGKAVFVCGQYGPYRFDLAVS